LATWSDKKEFILKAVEEMYTDVASRPGAVFHFPTGRLACLYVGYPADQLDCLPAEATESFAGVSYPFVPDIIREGDAVLDVGSGSGTDTLIAAMLVGPTGIVYGLDMTLAMREKLERNVAAMKIGNVRVVEGNAEQIPLPDASIDVVTSNGVLNLVPDKTAAFGEIARVLKPGGRLQISDIALRCRYRSSRARIRDSGPSVWSGRSSRTITSRSCVQLVWTSKCSATWTTSPAASTRAPDAPHGLGAHAIVMRGCKPEIA
jgi:SAM-dependent methyltransferase